MSKISITTSKNKPEIALIDPKNIPLELRNTPQWVMWCWVRKRSKWTKVPGGKVTVRNANPTDPKEWMTFEEAFERHNKPRILLGLGFVFSENDPYCGIDLDDCVGEDGIHTEWAGEIIDNFNSYAEFSPTGTGIKIFTKAKKPGTNCRKKYHTGEVEIYDEKRFFTVTGKPIAASKAWKNVVTEGQNSLNWIYNKLFGRNKKEKGGSQQLAQPQRFGPGQSDEELIKIASEKNPNFASLFRGDTGSYGEDHSSADLALCNHLAYWTNGDSQRMDRIFRSSGLMRPKWDEMRGDTAYGDMTIRKALEDFQPRSLVPFRHKGGGGGWNPERSSAPSHLKGDRLNASDLARLNGQGIRYISQWGKFYVYDGLRWTADDNTVVVQIRVKLTQDVLIKQVEAELEKIQGLSDEENKEKKEGLENQLKRLNAWQNQASIRRSIDSLKSEPGIMINHSCFDSHHWMLNCLNGTVDLKTGELRQHNRENYLTQLCPVPYNPDADCPNFLNAVTSIFNRDESLILYVQRLLGYCLTGSCKEQIIPIWWGGGSNGKSTLLNTILAVFGDDYSGTVNPKLLTESAGNEHDTIRAALFRKRLMVCSETGEGGRLKEAAVKSLTGQDKIQARRMREDYWEFDPTHKIILQTNHRPEVRGTDHGLWRRVRLIPFGAQFLNPDAPENLGKDIPNSRKIDPNLSEKLEVEKEGILAWLVTGAVDYHEGGMRTPKAVMDATNEYRSREDVLGDFLAEKCATGEDFRIRATTLYESYKKWAESNGHRPESAKRFGDALAVRKIEKYHSNGIWYRGLMLTNN